MNSTIVLAGGSSSRFGIDKSLLKLGDRPLISWVTSALAPFGQLIISISSKHEIEKYKQEIKHPHKFAVDTNKNAGPFGGLLSATKLAEGEYIAVAPCDAPFITYELYQLLFEYTLGFDGAVPKIGGYWEPLIAVYKKEPLLNVLQTNFELNSMRISEICTKLNVIEVSESELKRNNIGKNCFFNINKPEDLAEAEKYLPSKR